MDPLSIVGGIWAVGQATGAIVTCAEIFYEIADRAGVLTEDVELFAFDIEVFGSITSNVHSTIKDHYEKYSNSIAIRKFHKHATLQKLAFQSKHLMRRAKDLQPQLKGDKTDFDLWARFQWVRKKAKREDISLSMLKVKMDFLLILHQIYFEALEQRASNPSSSEQERRESHREKKKCKRMIRMHVKSITVLNDRQKSSPYRRSQSYKDDPESSFDDTEEFILEFAMETVNGRVFAASSLSSANTGSRLSDEGTYRESQVNDTHHRFRRQRDHPSHLHHPQSSRSETFNSIARGGITPQPAAVPMQQIYSPESLSPPTNSSITGSQEGPGPVEASYLVESDYMNVQASDNILHLDPHLNFEIIEGYVNSNVQPTNAILTNEFSHNLISELCAAELGLQVKYSHEEDDVDVEDGDHLNVDERMAVDFGNEGEHLVIGTVTFDWKMSQVSRPLKVACLVCENVPTRIALVFGKLYLDRRRHYWGK